jgi:hypothetical protein
MEAKGGHWEERHAKIAESRIAVAKIREKLYGTG